MLKKLSTIFYFTLRRVTAVLMLLAATIPVAITHPHSWLNLTSDFVINPEGQVIEVNQRWLFDTLYSTLTIDDINKQYPNETLGFKLHGQDIVNHLGSVNYYSHLQLADQRILLPKPSTWNFYYVTAGQDKILVLEMNFVLPKAIDATNEIKWQVYDPTYYVSMLHDNLEAVRVTNDSALECEHQLEDANPSDEQVMYAASLDQSQQAEDGLGKYFAQTVRLQCF